VRRGSGPLHVSDRGFELIAALALLPPGTSKEELASAIWPGLDGEAALNSLKMCVSRTRAQIVEKEAIVSTKRGYALSEAVPVDVREFERLLRGLRGVETLGDSTRRDVEEAVRALEARERTYTSGWAWFAPHAAHLDDLQRDLAMALAKDSFRRDGTAVKPYAGVSISTSS
jgi:DNA-binding SARP family transcriptional activator